MSSYYCRFCGCGAYQPKWNSGRCPKCGTSVPPKKW